MNKMHRYFLFCGIPALLFYVVSLTLLTQSGFTLIEILRDTAQSTGQSSFLGFLSNIGVWFWVAAGAICLARALSFERGGDDRLRRLLFLVGGFSLVLAADDFFLIHDRYIAEGIVVPLYAIFLWRLLSKHRQAIFAVNGAAFLGAGALLGMSVGIDAVQEVIGIPYAVNQVIEEGMKFLGAATWLYFCYEAAALRERIAAPAMEEPVPPIVDSFAQPGE
ncbi:hypothetical protein [Roseovarius sp.]|uniref:hypothetical protein n=1 Tax=Roseovarius sp. TaxID=1486281 RepID=UPI00262A18F4|nr:hypothetical protein [Roseovarius sp.]MDM8165150.1 hypothetical protein [Roseovarius sp.]